MIDPQPIGWFTGVGSRETPEAIQKLETSIAHRLWCRGVGLRSGGAKGSDQAFEAGVPAGPYREIYVPWARFEQDKPDYILVPEESDDWKRAEKIAQLIHPNFNAPGMLRGNRFGQRAHTRNVFQVLGRSTYSRSDLLICWAPWKVPGESVTGGTNTAVRLALESEIPVFNLVDGQSAVDALTTFVLERYPHVVCDVCGEADEHGCHDPSGELPSIAYSCPDFTLDDALDCHAYVARA